MIAGTHSYSSWTILGDSVKSAFLFLPIWSRVLTPSFGNIYQLIGRPSLSTRLMFSSSHGLQYVWFLALLSSQFLRRNSTSLGLDVWLTNCGVVVPWASFYWLCLPSFVLYDEGASIHRCSIMGKSRIISMRFPCCFCLTPVFCLLIMMDDVLRADIWVLLACVLHYDRLIPGAYKHLPLMLNTFSTCSPNYVLHNSLRYQLFLPQNGDATLYGTQNLSFFQCARSLGSVEWEKRF